MTRHVSTGTPGRGGRHRDRRRTRGAQVDGVPARHHPGTARTHRTDGGARQVPPRARPDPPGRRRHRATGPLPTEPPGVRATGGTDRRDHQRGHPRRGRRHQHRPGARPVGDHHAQPARPAHRCTPPPAARSCWHTYPNRSWRALAAPLERCTPHTVTDPGTLRTQLKSARADGCAYSVEELETGLNAVAAPVFTFNGRAVAALSASGPSFRLPEQRLPEVSALVRAAAEQISNRLGHLGRP